MSEETKPQETSAAAEAPKAAEGAEAAKAAEAPKEGAAAQVAVQSPELPKLEGSEQSGMPAGLGLEHLFDISMGVSVELGTTRLPIETLVKLGPGSVITLDRSATEPVDIYVNGKPVARGEVVTIGESYGVRITSVLDHEARAKAVG